MNLPYRTIVTLVAAAIIGPKLASVRDSAYHVPLTPLVPSAANGVVGQGHITIVHAAGTLARVSDERGAVPSTPFRMYVGIERSRPCSRPALTSACIGVARLFSSFVPSSCRDVRHAARLLTLSFVARSSSRVFVHTRARARMCVSRACATHTTGSLLLLLDQILRHDVRANTMQIARCADPRHG